MAVLTAARLAEGVELVEEDDAAAHFAGLCEQVADPAGTDADILLDEVGAARVVERNACLGGDRARQHRLAGARRAVEHDAARNAGAELVEPFGRAQELDGLRELELRLLDTRDV